MTETVFADMMTAPDDPGAFDAMAPENIAPLVVWLGSIESRDVTGRVFEVEAGKVSLADGWQHGPVVDKGDRWDPAELGPVVRELLSKGAATGTGVRLLVGCAAVRRAWLLVIVAAFVFTACDAPTRPEHTTRLTDYGVNGALQVNGSVEMNAVVQYPTTDGGPLRLGAPTLGQVGEVTIGNSRRSASGETVDVDPQESRAFVSWVVHGVAERYSDGAIVTLALWTPPDGVNADDKRVHLAGNLTLPAPPVGTVHWHGASPANLTVSGTTISFQGEIGTTTPSELSFIVPAESLPVAPVLPGASRVASFEDRQATADLSDAHLADDIKNDRRREDLEENLYWGAVGLEIAIPFVITLIVILRAAGVRRRATRDVPEELNDPPSDLPPAVVALLQADARDIGPEAAAATILDLAQRHALTIEAISGERYTLKVAGSATRPGEAALLAALGALGTTTGPPLAVKREQDWWRALRRDVVAIAREKGLLRHRYPSGLFLSAVVALAITTIPLYARSPEALVGGIVVATILAAIPFVGGFVLTGAGHRERARWEAYRRHLAAADLGDVPAPGVIVWESALVYAAALGIATTAIKDLS